jgi:hypothetical protein
MPTLERTRLLIIDDWGPEPNPPEVDIAVDADGEF